MPCEGARPYRTPSPPKKAKKSLTHLPNNRRSGWIPSKKEGREKKLCFLLHTPEEDGDSRAVDSTMKGPSERGGSEEEGRKGRGGERANRESGRRRGEWGKGGLPIIGPCYSGPHTCFQRHEIQKDHNEDLYLSARVTERHTLFPAIRLEVIVPRQEFLLLENI